MMGSAHFLINDHMELLLSVLEFWKDIRNSINIILHLNEAYWVGMLWDCFFEVINCEVSDKVGSTFKVINCDYVCLLIMQITIAPDF